MPSLFSPSPPRPPKHPLLFSDNPSYGCCFYSNLLLFKKGLAAVSSFPPPPLPPPIFHRKSALSLSLSPSGFHFFSSFVFCLNHSLLPSSPQLLPVPHAEHRSLALSPYIYATLLIFFSLLFFQKSLLFIMLLIVAPFLLMTHGKRKKTEQLCGTLTFTRSPPTSFHQPPPSLRPPAISNKAPIHPSPIKRRRAQHIYIF